MSRFLEILKVKNQDCPDKMGTVDNYAGSKILKRKSGGGGGETATICAPKHVFRVFSHNIYRQNCH